jgi:hypothetical protein
MNNLPPSLTLPSDPSHTGEGLSVYPTLPGVDESHVGVHEQLFHVLISRDSGLSWGNDLRHHSEESIESFVL